ncbi:gamma-glutamyltranspeptidase [Halobacillus andaensis]|uniref:Gamma-glutamyltranspeptidase n=1 Tax=Halobacillus andaensis TaxID=1176239 RepID=A0A917B2T0_HALAA|nr:gamma-glutamyltransferase [Halobacillus andaensis]MBP2004735.1 gamma-glutamyltranspeptidase/glutathione hydrolase [Halobacillus andaensis]GGF19360.1 gamma-glutamyltranspeptidase [Halobacillus andaensis]
MNYLRITNILAVIVFIGLVGWNYYFEDEFDAFREPYRDEEPSETVEISADDEESFVYGVSALHPLAVEAGMEVLNEGGNAAEAAIAVSFTLGVVEPYGSGVGGGGQMVVQEPDQEAVTYDYREAAPESGGWPERGVAIPGFVKGMEALYEDYGENKEWADLLARSIEYGEEGFEVGRIFNEQIQSSNRYLLLPEEERNNYYPDGQPIAMNENLVQTDLAETLKVIRDKGADGFYEGELGQQLSAELEIPQEDLASYEVARREAAAGTFKDHTVYAGSSPTSGVIVIQALQMMERLEDNFDEVIREEFENENGELPEFLADGLPEDMEAVINDDEWQALYIHLVNKITDRVYSERVSTLGDPQFDDIDQEELTSKEYTDNLFDQEFSEEGSGLTSSSELFNSPGELNDSRNTTHFVVRDKDGMMVSTTNSLGEFFGSGRYTNGFFLNNQLNNFSTVEGAINEYEPGKRPRSFVSPMIFAEDGEPVLGLGSPGGSRIPAMLIQTFLQYEYGRDDSGEPLNLQEAIMRPRFYTEDNVVHLERMVEDTALDALRGDMNYSVITHDSPLYYGGIQGLGMRTDEEVVEMFGGGDSRRLGTWQIADQEGLVEDQTED